MPETPLAPLSDSDRLLQHLREEHYRLGMKVRPVAIAFNVGLALLFAFLEVWPLTASYVAGCVFYAWVFKVILRPDFRPEVLVLWVWLVIFAQALLAVLLLGPRPGFQLYLACTLVPSFSSLKRPFRHKLFQGAVIILFFLLTDAWLSDLMPPYALSPEQVSGLRQFNIIGFCVTLVWLTHLRAHAVHETEQALRRIASSDPLTGLFNRRAIGELLDREVARSQRTSRPLALILCDIDHFKRINDTWGHAAGDHVLQTIASLLQTTVRDYDCVARWGGEEFLILLPDATSVGASAIAERLRAAVEGCAIHFEGQTIPVSMTLGVSQLMTTETWRDAAQRADEALYRGKAAGRNSVETG